MSHKQKLKTGLRVQWICPAGTGRYGEKRQRGTVKEVTAKRVCVHWDVGLIATYKIGSGLIRRVRHVT